MLSLSRSCWDNNGVYNAAHEISLSTMNNSNTLAFFFKGVKYHSGENSVSLFPTNKLPSHLWSFVQAMDQMKELD